MTKMYVVDIVFIESVHGHHNLDTDCPQSVSFLIWKHPLLGATILKQPPNDFRILTLRFGAMLQNYTSGPTTPSQI